VTYAEITFKDFQFIAKKRGLTKEMLVDSFHGKIEEPTDFFERVMTCKHKGEDLSTVVIPYRSVIEFYLKELHYLEDSGGKQRRCACGCGVAVYDRKKFANSACRKRFQRKGP